MKILKAKIEITHNDGGTQYNYPNVWLDNKHLIPMVVYQADRTDDIVEGEKMYQTCYLLAPDELYTEMLSKHPDIFSVANAVDFDAFSNKHSPQKEIITDQSAVFSVLSKATLGTPLTTKEKQVIDAKDPTAGINLTRSMLEIATNDYGATT